MNIPRHHSKRKEWAQYLLLGLPTAALMAFGIFMANEWLAVLANSWISQSLAFTAGLAFAIGCFARRFRFVSLTAGLLGIFYLCVVLGKILFSKELDGFFFETEANNYFIFFLAGWLAGYGFSRSRFFTIFWSVTVLAVIMLVIAHIIPPLRRAIMLATIPVIAYVVYIIYTGEFLRNMNEDQTGFRWFVARRLIMFGLLIAMVISMAFSLLKTEFTTIEKEWENGGKPRQNNERQNSLTRNDGMGTSTQNSMGLQGFNNRANKDSVMFVAKLDHFFPETEMPNPLYFVSDFYSRFDTLTQTFETDSLRPYNDLFQPDLLSLPLYHTMEDTSVVRKSMATLLRNTVTVEVYKTSLSPRHFTAPSTAFFVQPISVPNENKDLYKSAYRAKMMVSDLNSAYFVYNPAGDVSLELFQEQRFAALRMAEDYSSAPSDFITYYTQMPIGGTYDSIRALANQIADSAGSALPIDRVIAVRDYFLETDSSGNPTFRYSDNPGIPGIPGANKLTYFLFDIKKGYCAYYAGATLFLLRALGIPSRIATGFLTVDRSNKNPGWYWFYEDQAHAWVQVWFPGFGWLDFDTTVPSTETQEAPQPDQTPPLTSQTAWLVANGNVLKIDTMAKQVQMQVHDIIYWDNPVAPPAPQPFLLDISLARIMRDTGQVSFTDLKSGMDIVAVSFSEQFKEIEPALNEKWESLVSKFPAPLPIDEIKIIAPVEEQKRETAPLKLKKIPWMGIARWLAIAFLVFIVLALWFPYFLFQWFGWRAKRAGNLHAKAYHSYMASLLFMHQLGYRRYRLTPLQLAASRIDPQLGTNLASFIKTYQKLKYTNKQLNDNEKAIIEQHYPAFINQVRNQIPFRKRFIAFLKPAATIEFFTQPNILGSTKNTSIWNSM